MPVQPGDELPPDKRVLLEQFDNFAELRNGLKRVAAVQEHWAGIPMPMQDAELIIEPKYPNAEALSTRGNYTPEQQSVESPIKIRNAWWSDRLRGDIYIYEDEAGKVQHLVAPKPHMLKHSMLTLGCSYAWGIEQESRALNLLATLVQHHTFKQYLLTGMFMETSKRSGLTYLFRKLRPTVVLDVRAKDSTTARILCALCLHPIAYYADSWAGAMCPTDDVIAHLSLMRGDEHMFWKRSNQHLPGRPEAGL